MKISEAIIVLQTLRIGCSRTEKQALDVAIEILELAEGKEDDLK